MNKKDYPIGSYFVSLKTIGNRVNDEIIKVVESSKTFPERIGYKNCSLNEFNTIRPATQQEIDWHLQNPSVNRIITNMPKEPVINNNYSIY